MKIKKVVSRNRRDFRAIYECEHCGHENEAYGYDDNNFHANIVPKMKCTECGKSAGDGFKPEAPRYPEGMTV